MTKRLAALLMLLAVFAFGFAACGDDDESTTSGDSTSAESAEPGEPVAEIDPLTGVATKVTLDKGFVDALTQLKLTPGVVGDATLEDDGAAVQFPITGGNVTYYDPAEPYRPYVQGTIEHDNSGLSLTAGKTVVELTDFVIDPGTSELFGTVSANGKVAAENAKLFDLDGSTLKPLQTDEGAGTATLEGTTVLLSDDAAALLNDTFKTDALAGGFPIGISEITVELPS
jgi:hypothetical protein